MKNAQELLSGLLGLIRPAAYYGHTANLLMWDKETGMPKGAGPDRDEILGFVATKATETFIDPRIGETIENILSRRDELHPNQLRLIERIDAIYGRAKAVPLDLVRKWNETTSRAQRYWTEARARSDFSIFLPHLEEVLKLLRERAQSFGYKDHPYNAIVPDYEPGVDVAELQRILLPLREPLSGFVSQLTSVTPPDNSCLTGAFPTAEQMRLSRAIIKQMGFDFNIGRMDGVAGHPMTIPTGPKDTRFTTRFSPENLYAGLFASIHEGGHCLYCQGMDPIFDWLYIETGISMAIHESQSRMWENIVGRGMPFWRFFFPQVQTLFAPSFDGVTIEDFWRAVNVVRPSLIRIHADEVTYNLHILLRFELELALLSGDLKPADLPEAWNEKMEEYLGIRPENDAEGCLQDVHWSRGYFGYFPTYTLGNLLAAQLWETITDEIPDIEDEISQGNLNVLLEWLRSKVHHWGMAYTLPQLAEEVTGLPLDSSVWMEYILNKYSEVYGL